MKNTRSPLKLIPPALKFAACLLGLLFATGITLTLATAHYMGGSASYTRTGIDPGTLADDSLIGEPFSWVVPDATLAQLLAVALTGTIFMATFVLARLVWKGFSRRPSAPHGDLPSHWKFYLPPNEMALLVFLILAVSVLVILDYQLYAFRAVSDALLPVLKGKYVPFALQRWDLVREKHGELYSIDLIRIAAVGYIAATVCAAVIFEWAWSRARDTGLEFLKAIEANADEEELEAVDPDARETVLVEIIGTDPPERRPLSEVRDDPDRYVTDEHTGVVYLRTHYEELFHRQSDKSLNGGPFAALVFAVIVGLGLLSAAPSLAASNRATTKFTIVVDPTGSFPFRKQSQAMAVEGIKALAGDSSDPRHAPKARVHWWIVSGDAFPSVIAQGTELDVEKLEDAGFWTRLFEDRRAYAHCTDVVGMYRAALQAVGPPDRCVHREIVVLSDLRDEPVAKKRAAPCEKPSYSPPGDMPWDDLKTVPVTNFFSSRDAINAWQPTIRQHGLTQFTMYSGAGPHGRIQPPPPDARCERDGSAPLKLLTRAGAIGGVFALIFAAVIGVPIVLSRRNPKRSRGRK